MLALPFARKRLAFAALSVFALVLGGCAGSSGSNGSCGTHHYAYLGGAAAVPGGAAWYGGAGGYSDGSYGYGGGWYDPGDDGTDYANGPSGDGSGSNGDGSGDGTYSGDGSGNDGSGSGGDGTGNDGSGSDGSGSDGSGSDGSGSDGSGSDGSGGDGSGDDGTASKKHLHTTSVGLHTQSSPVANSCYAYSCTLVCLVGDPSSSAAQQREARGESAISSGDACTTAAHGIETWAHQSLGQDVAACKQVTSGDPTANPATNGARAPATPAVKPSAVSSGSVGVARSLSPKQ